MMTVGGRGAMVSRWAAPPRSSTSSLCTIFTTCWPGVRLWRTSWPTAFSRTRSTNERTTLKLTSASRRATRTSRSASWMLSSVRRPAPRRRSKIASRRVVRASNIGSSRELSGKSRKALKATGHPMRRQGRRRMDRARRRATGDPARWLPREGHPSRERGLLPSGLGLLLGDFGHARRRALHLRRRLLGGRWAPGQALLERVHEVDHLGALGLGPRRGHFPSGHLLLGRGQDPLAVVVLVLARSKLLVRQLVDQARCQIQLAVLDLRALSLVDLAEIPHLVREVHRVQHEPALGGSDQHKAFLAPHHELGERHPVRLGHRVSEQPVGLLTTLVGAEVVRLFEVDRVDLRQGDELRDVDDLGGFALETLQLLVSEADVLVLLDLVALDESRSVDDLLVDRAIGLLADPVPALGVEQVEADPGRRGGGVHADRDRDQPEGDRARPDRMRWHDASSRPG